MRQFFERIWPAARARTLERERNTLSTALASATRKTVELQSKLDQVLSEKCDNCETLKQTINFLVFAAGSRHPMFEGYGPTLPKLKYADKDPEPVPAPQRASHAVKNHNREFVKEFMEKERLFAEKLEREAGFEIDDTIPS